jgi:amino acid adenylation domain-containing protein/non-ribosomal peptide synthase protein (TIGR01720 family)
MAENTPKNIESVYPLSPMQEGMLFHTLLLPGSGIYLMQNRYRLRGELQQAQFIAAWERVVARHPVLRTSFVWKSQKRPLQVVHKQLALPFEVRDWRELTPEQCEQRLQRELSSELEAGFDFVKAPLQRFRLVRVEDQLYEFVHSFHHIVLDEWCTSIVMTDFVEEYAASLRGEPAKLPPSRPYRDYIDYLGRKDLAQSEAFWRRYLAGFDTPNALGFEVPQGLPVSGVEDLSTQLDTASTAALAQLAQRHKLTLNTIAQAAWALVLARYSGEEDVVFGVTVSGRPADLPGVESIVGLFINTLPLRVQTSANEPLVPWLRRLFEQNLTLREYEHTSLTDIQRWSAIERGQQLFQSLFVFENAPIDPALLSGRVFQVESVQDRVHTNYPVTIMAWPGRELGLKVSFDKSKVPVEVATRLLHHMRSLLEGMAQRPGARLGELSILTEAERVQALERWNAPLLVDAEEKFRSYSQCFSEQVGRAPNALAARSGQHTLTYAELDRRATQLAQCMAVGGDDIVAVFDVRGLDWLVMVLAIFKAGAAYMPIDPEFPDARVAKLCSAAKPRMLLTRELHVARLKSGLLTSDCQMLTLEAAERTPVTTQLPQPPSLPSQLAYVIFTSGSTGEPKGVMVEAQGMLANMLSKLPRFQLEPGDVVAQTAAPCFDISVWQLLTPLLFGGTVEIVPDDIVREPARLLSYLNQRNVAIAQVVPALLQALAQEAPLPLPKLRWLLPTGEALSAETARAWFEVYPHIPLMNTYGPAECSDDVAMFALTRALDTSDAQVPIGARVEHCQLYVLDSWLSPVPVGVTGELYVGGLAVGRGYLADAQRTAEAFVPDPFSAGKRLYRTGDLVRQRADGSFEFVGRRDHQVKVRGYRIELAEIEARLLEHPSVSDAVVVVREDRPGARRLVGYVSGPGSDTTETLRPWIEARLPRYMVPARVVRLAVLPRNVNGKLDRRALPAPELNHESVFVEARDDTERALAAIWCDLLGLERVSMDASFFELGGHSLLLTQVLARVRKALSVEVPLRALFEAVTLADQASAVRAAAAVSSDHALTPVPRDTILPLTFAQERLWFLAQLDPEASAYNVPAFVRLRGTLDVDCLTRAWQQLVARHEALRTRFVDELGRVSQCFDVVHDVPLAVTDLSALEPASREQQLEQLLAAEASRAFALREGPLYRMLLVKLAPDEHVFAAVLHHSVSDGWSMNVLVRDMAALYSGQAASLPELSVQYGDYAAHQRGAQSLEEHVLHFQQRLAGAPQSLTLPLDRARPALRSQRGARHFFQLDASLRERLRHVARERQVTLYMLLLSGFEVLLAALCRQDDFCIGTPVANRTRIELEELIGFFANTLVLRADVRGEPSFDALLERTRKEVIAAQAHQDAPFERVVQALAPARDLRSTPLFQVMFSLQELPPAKLELPGLAWSAIEIDPKVSQFDLSLHMTLDADELGGVFEYSTDVLTDATMAAWAEAFLAVLGAVVEDSARSITTLVKLAPPESLPAVEEQQVHVAARYDEVEAKLSAIWAAALGRSRVEPTDNFFELGGDSILSLQVVARAKAVGLRLTARQMFQTQSLAALAHAARHAQAQLEDGSEQGALTGAAPLIPIQRKFFARGLPNPHHWNQALLLTVRDPWNWSALQGALDAVVAHHDALRFRYVQHAHETQQHYAEIEGGRILQRTDLSRQPPEQRGELLTRHASRWQASFDLAVGPLLRAIAFDYGESEPGRLLLLAHHLVIDGVSWRIVLDDLQLAYSQLCQGTEPALSDKTVSFRQWGEHLQRAANDPALQLEAAQWLELPWSGVQPLRLDDSAGDPSEAQLALSSLAFTEDTTRNLLERAAKAQRLRPEEIMIAGLVAALAELSGGSAVALGIEAHGREPLDDGDLDLSRSVGWFTSVFPAVFALQATTGPRELLASVKETLRKLPRRGLAFGVVSELGEGELAQALRALPKPEVAFNYLGQWDSAADADAQFTIATEPTGAERDPRGRLGYELEIDAAVYRGQLDVTFRYSAARFRAERIAALGRAFRDTIEALVEHCLTADQADYTASDFPDVSLAQGELESILEQLS